MTHKNNDFHYTQCGLDYVYLSGGVEFKQRGGEEFYKIKDVDALNALIAEKIITSSARMMGQEVKFLRSLMRITQATLANLIGKQRDAIARLESSSERDKLIPVATDKAIRTWYILYLKDEELIRRAEEIVCEIEEADIEKEIELNYDTGWFVDCA